ncbi:MAG: aspartate aminotransferase family protein [Proteobacteria bacterium]|nr:aspartate aminotransferase family protein [Pseudomonadota bacterium]
MANSLLERDARVLAGIGKLRTFPLTIANARGNRLIEEDDRAVLDLSGAAGAALLGYGHPAVVAAANRGLTECASASDMFGASESAVALAEDLLALCPFATDHKVWFGHSGSDANDMVMRAVQAATGRRRFMSFYGAYHGGVSGSMSVSSHPSQQHSLPRAGLVQIPYPNPYRPIGGGDAAQVVFDQLDFLFSAGAPPGDIGALFIEPLQSDGGMIVPPPGFLAELVARCRRHGILIVSDEVKVGLGRPGCWHCYEAEGFTPDIVTFGKGLGSGVPISAVVAPRAIMDFQEAFALITTTGNSVSTSVVRAVLATIESEKLYDNAAARGEQIMTGLRALQESHPLIGQVRGRGLAIGIELVRDRATREPATREAAKVVLRAYQLGVVFTYVGMASNVPELTPPLTLSREEADEAVAVIGQAIADVEDGLVSDDDVAAYAGW